MRVTADEHAQGASGHACWLGAEQCLHAHLSCCSCAVPVPLGHPLLQRLSEIKGLSDAKVEKMLGEKQPGSLATSAVRQPRS